jgi:hypothetical protein
LTLSLTAIDNQNNTGLTGTITGSDSGSVNTVYASVVNQGDDNLTWSPVGTRTSDGTLNLNVAPGYYFFYASGLVGGILTLSPPIIAVASIAVLSIQHQCELAIQAKIQTLQLIGLSTPPGHLLPQQVYRFDTVMSDQLLLEMQYPAIAVTPAHLPEAIDGRLTGKDDVGYPVQVLIIDRAAPYQQGLADTYKLWRQQIIRAIRFQRLVTVPQVMKVVPEPQAILDWQPSKLDYVYSAVVFRAVNRETRGV